MSTKETVLIAYFTQKGKEKESATARVAAQLTSCLAADYDPRNFDIIPVETYPTDSDVFMQAARAELETNARPEIMGKYNGMASINKIVLVVPNWFNSVPMAVMTFLDQYDFAGKRIIPVVIHHGDGGTEVADRLRHHLRHSDVYPCIAIKDTAIESDAAQLDAVLRDLSHER